MIEEITNKINIKCDTMGCDNKANFVIGIKKHFIYSKIYLCKSCMNEIYKEIGQIVVPKSPQNILKKNTGVKNYEK